MADTKLAKVGITVKESWKDDISYEVLDYTLWRVQDGGDGCGYIAKRANIGVVPNSDDSVWIKATQAGQSIYDLAVKYGHFVGTEEEFEAEYQAALQAARDAASETSATNAEIQEAEELRRASEDERAEAETARQESEIAREAFESDRQIAENMRQMAETQRGENETTRQSQETARESSETQRQSNESTRQSNETARESAEQERTADFEALKTDMETAIGEADAATAAAVALNNQVAGDESARQQAEQSRVAAETQRQTAETQRGTNEQTRQTQETARQTAEQTRQTQEGTRQTQETARQTAEGNRASAESQRASNETSRVAAETARETQASSDHQRADSDHAIAEEDHATLDEKISHKADIDGSYDGMAVGIARNLEGRTDVTDSFFKRTTGGDAEVANGTAQLNEVKGKSQVWNQEFSNPRFENGISGWSPVSGNTGTLAYVDGVLEFTSKVSAPSYEVGAGEMGRLTCMTGHKYLVVCEIKYENTANIYFGGSLSRGAAKRYDTPNEWARLWVISQATENKTNANCYFSLTGSTTVVSVGSKMYLRGANAFDLTLIFGAGNEPTSLEEFEAWLSENIGLVPFYPYSEGEVLNNRMTGVESIGFNLLDPATGKADIIGAYSDVYGNYYGITGTHGTLTFTDKFGNTETITPDEDGKFLLETAGTLSVADAGEDCAVFLWWDGTQTEYKPYEKNVGALDVTHIYGKLNGEGDYVRVWPTGMPGIGDIKDSIKVVDGQVVAERKVGEVDMGTLAWRNTESLFYSNGLNGIIKEPSNTYERKTGLISSMYHPSVTLATATMDDMSMLRFAGSYNLYLKNNSKSAIPSQQDPWLSGILLYFELATPQVYTDLIYRDSESFADNTPVTLPVNYKVDNWGIERIAPQNTEEAVVTAKPELTMRYSIDAVEELNTHRDEIDDLYEKNEELDERKPEKYGNYPQMSVGSAKTLEGDSSVPSEYVFRKVPTGAATGLAMMMKVKGKSLVMNQLAPVLNSEVCGPSAADRSEVTFVDDYVHCRSKVEGTGAANTFGTVINNRILKAWTVQGHKYLVAVDYRGSVPIYLKWPTYAINPVFSDVSSSWIRLSRVITANRGGQDPYGYIASAPSANWDTDSWFDVKNLVLYDLTLMFGEGNEPATYAEFEALYPLKYYAFNGGEIVNNGASGIKTVGLNQLNVNGRTARTSYTPTGDWVHLKPHPFSEDEYLVGYSSGDHYNRNAIVNYSVQDGVVVVNSSSGGYGLGFPMRVMPNTVYYNKQSQGIIGSVGFYDKDGWWLGNVVSSANNTFTTPAGCYWAVIEIHSNSLNQNIASEPCISISDATKNGTFEPYKEQTLPLNLTTLTGKANGEGESVFIAPDGLKSAGSAYDEAVVENGYITKIIKRVGQVDLGGMSWIKSTDNRVDVGYYFNSGDINSVSGNKLNRTSSKYAVSLYPSLGEAVSAYGSSMDKMVFCIASNSVAIIDSSYETAADFKAAMDGVMLNYELATPVTYVLDTPVYVGFQIASGGTEQRLPVDTESSVTAPFVSEEKYAIDATGILNGLPQNYTGIPTLDALLATLGTALNGTLTKTWDATNQKYTFTFTHNA